MRIAIVYQYYQNHGSAGHAMVYDVSHFLAGQGHQVTVISGDVGYMHMADAERRPRRRLLRRERDGQVEVIRAYVYPERHKGLWGRLASFVSFSLSAPMALLAMQRPDVVLGSSPPLFPVFSTSVLCWLRRIPYVVEVRDLWPASAVEMGALRSRVLIRIMQYMERALYDRARRIVALTEGIRGDICARGWPSDKVELITCGVDFEHLYPDPQAGRALRERCGWQDQCVVLYFGALGIANNMPVILRAAERLAGRGDCRFVLVGDGAERVATQEAIAQRGLTNVEWRPAVARAEARDYINAADVCIATLRDIPLFAGAIPTKLIEYMACAKPVLSGVRGESQGIVEASEAGFTFAPDDDAHLADLVERLHADPCAREVMGRRGLDTVRARFPARAMHEKSERVLLHAAGLPAAP